MSDKFLIERLHIDALENQYDAAHYFTVEGYVDTLEDARRLVSAAGVVAGTGWPTERGKTEPRLRYRSIPKLSS